MRRFLIVIWPRTCFFGDVVHDIPQSQAPVPVGGRRLGVVVNELLDLPSVFVLGLAADPVRGVLVEVLRGGIVQDFGVIGEGLFVPYVVLSVADRVYELPRVVTVLPAGDLDDERSRVVIGGTLET